MFILCYEQIVDMQWYLWKWFEECSSLFFFFWILKSMFFIFILVRFYLLVWLFLSCFFFFFFGFWSLGYKSLQPHFSSYWVVPLFSLKQLKPNRAPHAFLKQFGWKWQQLELHLSQKRGIYSGLQLSWSL